MSKLLTLRVEIVRSEKEKQQEELIQELKKKLQEKEQELVRLQVSYGYETTVNNELCDLLREHKIPFRPALEAAKRRKW